VAGLVVHLAGKGAAMFPADLHAFWQRTKHELQTTPVNTMVTAAPEHSGREYVTSLVSLDSFQGTRLRAWYSVPTDPFMGGKLPAILVVPGYGGDKPIPTHLAVSGFAVLTLYPRGQGESRQEWELEHSTKLTYVRAHHRAESVARVPGPDACPLHRL
jgi:cephalosporin-C deacetylase-like acetyl esterase